MINYKSISRNIRVVYGAMLAVIVTFVVLCEFHVLPLEGMLISIDPGIMYIIQVLMVFVVGLGILAALKGFNWCLHHKVLAAEGVERISSYLMFSNLRNCMLCGLMILGAIFYYGTLENWGMYYGLAAFVVSFFCLPSPEGVEIELMMDNTATQ